eukprot:1160382-Pelagomonas_calceolata.AAC.6
MTYTPHSLSHCSGAVIGVQHHVVCCPEQCIVSEHMDAVDGVARDARNQSRFGFPLVVPVTCAVRNLWPTVRKCCGWGGIHSTKPLSLVYKCCGWGDLRSAKPLS